MAFQAGVNATTGGVSRDFIEKAFSEFEENDPKGHAEFQESVEELFGMTFDEILDLAESYLE